MHTLSLSRRVCMLLPMPRFTVSGLRRAPGTPIGSILRPPFARTRLHLRPVWGGQAENVREDRVRTSNYHVRRGPSLGFVAQMLAQADRGRQVTPAEGGATYPSLVSDLDIFLPGEEIVLADVSRRLDIRV